MRDRIVLFICFILIGSMLLGQSDGADQSQTDKTSSKKDSLEAKTKVSMIGFGFQKHGIKASDQPPTVMKLHFTIDDRVPLSGKLQIAIASKTHVLQVRITSYDKGVVADIIKKEEKIVDDKKKMVIVKIGSIQLKASTTKFKENVQTGKVSIKSLSVNYDAYLNVLPEVKVPLCPAEKAHAEAVSKKKAEDDSRRIQ